MEKQKKNSVLIALIVILILLLLGSCGYILYDKGLISKPVEVNKLSSYEVECSYGLVPYIESLFVYTSEYDKDTKKSYFDFQKYNDKDSNLITNFLIHYLERQAIRNGFDSKLNNEEYNGEFSLSVDKIKLDYITKKVFNIDGLNDY